MIPNKPKRKLVEFTAKSLCPTCLCRLNLTNPADIPICTECYEVFSDLDGVEKMKMATIIFSALNQRDQARDLSKACAAIGAYLKGMSL